MAFSEGHALIIGVGSYQHSPENNVPITVADAQAVADVLKNSEFCGYPEGQVTFLSDSQASRAGVLAALDRLASTNTSNTVLIFYSGHGDYASNGTYALTTHDTVWRERKVDLNTALPQAELIEKIRNIPAQRVLLIFNACHSGNISPVLGGVPFLGKPLPSITANALLSAGSGRIIMTACRENQVSFIGSGSLTLFGQALCDGLRGQGVMPREGYISVYDLYTHIYFTVKGAVEQLDENLRKQYGNTQEPELTVLKGVGPFPVALFNGVSTLGSFPDHPLLEGIAVRRVDPAQSQWAYQQQIQQRVSGKGAVAIAGNVTNSPITTGSGNTIIQSGRDTIHAGRDIVQTGGDYVRGDKVSGDKIDAQRSQGFINRPLGPVSQHFGNISEMVHGNKNTGNINASGISGTGIAIGHGNQVQVQQSTPSGNQEFAEAFNRIYQQINQRPDDPDFGKEEITRTVKDIQLEAQKGEQASEKKLGLWLNNLLGMAEDIFEVTVATLTSPAAAFATVAKKVAAKAKEERG